ncbi:hypothetical protein K504DRAFT_478698 [Pleomassaria siparia CBS 279.74]|uniref:Zn(2)-C6 fungal-type domain-containing protein n=1 Tax=Pleomassaria siparia CBS 279.74 TaxID=1314801 RepID=A0A6G1KS03_9PLEO|nr:hypothetical protein K504DRAFT_478698 [Pleomassaria siparia CBS 279.74]
MVDTVKSVTRRSHRKSRTGCHECKRRRIKCNEEKPQCGNCIRHHMGCVYLSTGAMPVNQSPSEPPLPSISSSLSTLAAKSPLISRDSTYQTYNPSDVRGSRLLFDMEDLDLLHHWTLVTSISIEPTAEVSHIWQTVFPQLGLQHPHLMHSILSLSALHKAYSNPTNKQPYMLKGAQHHSESLLGFKAGITQSGDADDGALFVNATLIFIYAFVTSGPLYDINEDSADAASRTSRVLGTDWIPLLRGIRTILQPTYYRIKHSSLGFLLSIGNWDELDPDALSIPADKELLRIKEIWRGGENAEIYDETLYLLRTFCAWNAQFQDPKEGIEVPSPGYNGEMSGPFIFVSVAPEEYFKLLQQRQPCALILFAYFGTLLHSLGHFWWMEGCGKSIVAVVDECLGPFWDTFLEWPRRTVGLNQGDNQK